MSALVLNLDVLDRKTNVHARERRLRSALSGSWRLEFLEYTVNNWRDAR
jgi:hypothetical protein